MKPAKKRWANIRFRQRIQNILLAYYLTPILLVLLASGAFFYFSAQRALNEELGQRLTSIALAGASHVRGFHIAALELQDADNRTFQSLLPRFERLRNENNVARVYLFNHANESLLNTDPSISPGSVIERNRLQQAEIDLAWKGIQSSSFLYRGEDGSFYKSAFAPVLEGTNVVAVFGVDGSATFFRSLHLLGRQLLLFAIICIVIIVLVSVTISRKIVTPVQILVEAAERIGEGHLEQPVTIESQNEIGFLGFVLDEMRRNIVARDRELQVMLRGIAHEVRNPLGGMELFAGVLDEEVKDEASKEAVRRIQREIKTLKNLVEEFLDFARGPAMQLTQVKLEPFLEDLRVAFHRDFEIHSIRFHTTVEGVTEVEFDPDQMRRVFLNLIRNSIQAMPNGGEIHIVARAMHGGTVEISVRDTGAGISAEDLPRIFDPFFTNKEGGTGLGLSFVRKIVNAHGGEVRAESNVGKGTTFTIVLSA